MNEMKSWRNRFTNLRQPAPTSVYVVKLEFHADNIRSCGSRTVVIQTAGLALRARRH
jgi:hypothetical protein